MIRPEVTMGDIPSSIKVPKLINISVYKHFNHEM